MGFEIPMTKSKITKSMANQMRFPTLEVLKKGNPLGYLINIVKTVYTAVLIECEGNYYIISADYTRDGCYISRKVGKAHERIKFETFNACSEWWSAYQIVVAKATNQIYV